MTPWTEAAKSELEKYFSRIQPGLEASGADPREVLDDLRRHLDAEIASAALKVVTEHDVRRFLAKIGTPELAEASSRAESTAPGTQAAQGRLNGLAGAALLLAGVILPAITLGVEALTHMCAGAFFDPLPTVWHGALIAFLIVINAITWNAVRQNRIRWRRPLGWANGAAIVIASFYSFLFIPLLLPGLFAILILGWGLLPWSPLLALVATVILRNRLRTLDPQPGAVLPGFWRGALLGLVAVALAESPVLVTRVGMQMAISDSPQTQQAGLAWLRRVGDEHILLRACYGFTRGAQTMDLRGLLVSGKNRVSAEQAREIFYQVTGVAFNSIPAPTVRTGRGGWAELEDWTWDADHGGDRVGGRIRGLTLDSSRMDTGIDADAAWSYTEWTLEFRNDAVQNREARAQILLPPGGVVSRVTLWVNGEEREAAFAGRSHVREAYQEVAVQQRRDPILVTSAGPDRVMMQCFPVPPRGGLMKVRLGITAPLTLRSIQEGLMRLPLLIERNFSIPEETHHTVWVEATGAANTASEQLVKEPLATGGTAVHGRLTDPQLAAPHSLITIQRNRAVQHAWTRDPRAGQEGTIVQQSIVEQPVTAPESLVVVIDGSAAMAPFIDEVAVALGHLKSDIPLTILAACDGVLPLSDPSTPNGGEGSPRRIGQLQPHGGQDSVPALIEAREVASKTPGSVIVWIHAPQPVLIASPDALLQAYERQPNGPTVYELQTVVGPDHLINKLNGLPAIRSILRTGSLQDDLGELLDRWSTGATEVIYERHVVEGPTAASAGNAVETSLQLARLWALDEVRHLSQARRVEEAVRLAERYQIVTPVSGAVVLENAEQYKKTGLHPVDPQTVPSIPEPSSFALVLLSLGVLLMKRGFRASRSHCSGRGG